MGFTAGKGALSSAVGGNAQTQITVTASDVFALNDPVFQDWKTGAMINQNDMITGPAFSAGPAISTFSTTELVASGTASASSLVLPDGSLVTLVSTANNGGTLTAVNIHKYTSKGVLINKNVVMPTLSSYNGAQYYLPSYLSLALLSNGNIAASYSSNANTLASWAILDQNLQILYAGNYLNQSGNGFVMNVQPLTNGEFLALTTKGIDCVSATGSVTNVIAFDSYTQAFALQDELNHNAAVSDNPLSSTLTNLRPAQLSDGGFGYFLVNQTGYTYCKIKADGTLATTVIVASWGSQTPTTAKFAVLSGGNIAWGVTTQSTSGFFGIIGQDGSIVKVGAAMGTPVQGTFLLLPDAANKVLLVYYNGTNGQVRYMTATGADVATFPRALGINWAGNGFIQCYKLSTGTLIVCGSIPGYVYNYAFITLDGTSKTGVLANFKSGFNGLALGAMVVNDTIYGMAIAGNDGSVGLPDLIAFSVSNAGVVTATSQFVGMQLLLTGGVRVILDSTGKSMYAMTGVGRDSSSSTLISTIELSTLSLRQTYLVPYNLYRARLRPYAQGLLFLDTTTTNTNMFPASTQPVFGVFVKPRSTTFLGVAAAPAAPNDPMPVNTEGVYSTSAAWKYAVQTFDQTTNNPPGNAGHISGGVINLKGL